MGECLACFLLGFCLAFCLFWFPLTWHIEQLEQMQYNTAEYRKEALEFYKQINEFYKVMIEKGAAIVPNSYKEATQ